MRISALVAALAVVGCTDAKTVVDPNATAIEVVVRLEPMLQLDQVRVSGTIGGTEAFALGVLPEAPRPLGNQESFTILLPESLAGSEVLVRIDGLMANTVVTAAATRVTVRARQISRVEVTLTNQAFDVAAASIGNRQLTVTFSAPPDAAAATTLGNYTVPGLTLSGTPVLSNNTVTISTTPQSAIGYALTLSGITRAIDAAPLIRTTAPFTGLTVFNVASAASASSRSIVVTFDAAPNMAQATTLANYNIPGLTLSGTPVVTGNVVTIITSPQSNTGYILTVSGVNRAGDAEPLTVDTASFAGRAPFNVTSAGSLSSGLIAVTFDALPDPVAAVTLANYAVPGLTLSGTPSLSGTTITLITSQQSATTYTVSVSGVTRASDAESLTIAAATFTGTPPGAPTVTNVVVLSTSPNNGAIPYNTGTATVRITGTDLATVVCLTGVALDDLDGAGAAVGTRPTSCSVNSNTQITATFPAGIRTNGAVGWNVLVTNANGTNGASAVRFVPVAGLVISELYPRTAASTVEEYLELYNPTGTEIDVGLSGIGLQLHIRNAIGGDSAKTLILVNTRVPSHGFMLIVSAESVGTTWFTNRDVTYSAANNPLDPNGGVYISLSNTNHAMVIDKVGWGNQPSGGFEGTALAKIPSGEGVERKPAGGVGHSTDSDDNFNDFNASSAIITPRGTNDTAQP